MCGGDKQPTFLIKSCFVCWVSWWGKKLFGDFFIGSFLAQARDTHNEIAEAPNNRNSVWRDISERNHNVFITFWRYRWRGRASAVESSDLPAIRAVSLSRNKKGWKSKRRMMLPDNPLTSWSGGSEAALKDTHQWHCSLASEVVSTNSTKGPLFMCAGLALRSDGSRKPFRKGSENDELAAIERNWWHEAFYFERLFVHCSPAFCLMNGPLKRSLPLLLSFFCHATAIEWTAAGHKTQITITKGGIARFICFTPIASHLSSKIEFINSPFQPIKRKPSKSVICIEIYFYSAAARPVPPLVQNGTHGAPFFSQPNWII